MLPYTPDRTTRAKQWLLVAMALLATLVPQAALSQVLYGTLTGQVTDPSGASASGATVTVTNVDTGVVKTATTDDRGAYNLSDLLPGTYDVNIEAPAFQPFVQRGVPVTSNSIRRVDAQLSVSGVSETLEVTATAPLLQTDRADVHFVQTARQVNDLPLAGTAGRNYQSLMQIVPGAVLQGEQNSAAGSPQRSISFNVNGVSRLQNNTKLDGASIQYPWLPDEHGVRALERGHPGGLDRHQLLQRRAGPRRRRRHQRGHQVGHQRAARHRLGLQQRQLAPRAQLLLHLADDPRRHAEPVRRELRRTDPEEQALLLRQLGAHEAHQQLAHADLQPGAGRPARGRLQRHRRHHLRPGVEPEPGAAHAVPRQPHPGEPHRPGGRRAHEPHARSDAPRLRRQLRGAGRGRLQARQHRHQGQLPGELAHVAVRALLVFAVGHHRPVLAGRGGRRRAERRPGRHGTRARRTWRASASPTPSARTSCSTRTSATRTRSWAPRTWTSTATSAWTCSRSPARTAPSGSRAASPRSRSTTGRTSATPTRATRSSSTTSSTWRP